MDAIREPAVADLFYPADKRDLEAMLNKFLESEKLFDFNNYKIKALIVPHAGYVYSGKVSASAFKQISASNFKNIILVGPSHYLYFKGVALSPSKYWRTPFGEIELNYPKNIFKNKNCVLSELAHKQEHCLEVQLPFLQKILKDFKIIPILYGEINYRNLANLILDILDTKSLLVISSDLSHYRSYSEANEIDKEACRLISNLSLELFEEKVEACGKIGISALIKIAQEQKWRVRFLKYLNSGDTYGSKDKVVGYSSFIFYSL